MSAGDDLRATWDAELAAVDPALEWSPADLVHLGAAGEAADRAEVLRRVFAAEQAGEQRPAELVRISGELRLLARAIADHLGRVQVGDSDGPPKSAQHQAAARARWDSRRAERERNRQAAYGSG